MPQVSSSQPHKPVLLSEVLKIFEGLQLKIFFEGTVGAGGHARALLETHPEIECYLACDRDPAAQAIAAENLAPWGKKVEWIRGPYAGLNEYLDKKKNRGDRWIFDRYRRLLDAAGFEGTGI